MVRKQIYLAVSSLALVPHQTQQALGSPPFDNAAGQFSRRASVLKVPA
jgi:hypothetical protein